MSGRRMIVGGAELPLPSVLTTTIGSAHSGIDRSRFRLRGLTTGTRLRQGGQAPQCRPIAVRLSELAQRFALGGLC